MLLNPVKQFRKILILLGNLLGIPGEIALALSLVRRVRELALGIPGLAAWQFLEARHLLQNQQL